MSFRKEDVLGCLILVFCSLFLVFDLFYSKGLPATFDGRMHATMIAQFSKALSEGNFHVTWAAGFGNYGMPMPIIHQQVTSYLGGILNIIIKNVTLSTHLVYLIGAIASTIFYYFFLRIYFSPISSLAGSILFNFSAYRIFNIYIRGALPEFFAAVSLPLILIAIYYLLQKEKFSAFFLLIFSVALLILTHPFLLIIYAFIIGPYFLFNLINTEHKIKKVLVTTIAFVLAIGLCSYYVLPLVLETKYFYYGLTQNHFSPNQFATFANYFSNNWFYFYNDSPFVRGNFIPFGIIESLLLLIGLLVLVFQFNNINKQKNRALIFTCLVSATLLIFFTTIFSEIFYKHISILANIQHPWRLFSALLFIPPIILAFLLDSVSQKNKLISAAIILLFIAVLRFPQVYTKNNTLYPEEYFYFTKDNVAAVVLNPIWTGKSEEYPVKKNKIEIIEGAGIITNAEVKNASRSYNLDAKTQLLVADYTFYFPGWNVYIDEKPVPIEYQDQKYRGVITYSVPKGQHTVKVLFENTKVRSMANFVSLIFLGMITVLVIVNSYLRKYFYDK